MFEVNMTENVRETLKEAGRLAYNLGDSEIGTEHVLFGLADVENCVASRILSQFGVDANSIEKVLRDSHKNRKNTREAVTLNYSPRVKDLFKNAQSVAYELNSDFVVTEYVLYALLFDSTSTACIILNKAFKVDIDELKNAINKVLNGVSLDEAFEEQSPFSDVFGNSPFGNLFSSMFGGTPTMVVNQRQQNNINNFESARMSKDSTKQEQINSQLPEVLRDMGIDLTARARAGKMDPIIGRETETNRIIEILCRKTKNNPVLIGEAGVGKSAVVEGLAQAIVKNNVPELLQNKIIFSLEIGALMAGTKYRGSMEEKLKNAIDAIISSNNIIVFIDEIHMLAQAGGKEAEVSPADMLKPYLARGELQTIGATTTEEYRKFIEKDRALERRFQPIMVNQPSEEDTIKILKGLRDSYEAFHKVKITDEAIEASVNLSVRYIMDRFLPDKAIDLMDEASSRAKVFQSLLPKDYKDLESELKKFETQKKEALVAENFDKASEYKNKASEIREKMKGMKEDAQTQVKAYPVISAEDVARVVSKWTGIPVLKLTESEKERLLRLEDELHKRVIGQDEAVSIVSRAIRRARAGLKDPKRPIGTFIFLGPTGVGKTELTKALAESMFDDENNIVRIDMSEYMEQHSVAKLIGAPPGYVGHDDGGQLTKAVQRKPYSVVLFDEIEKAHPDVFNVLLQVLDEGRLTDSQGTTVSFKNTIIIMTSNVGVADLPKNTARLGFNENDTKNQNTKDFLLESLKKKFKPEFLNRIDATIVFDALSKDNIEKIAKIMLGALNKKLSGKRISLEFSKTAVDKIVEFGYDQVYGARPLKRVIEQRIEDKLAEEMISGRVADGDVVLVGFDKDFTFKKKN